MRRFVTALVLAGYVASRTVSPVDADEGVYDEVVADAETLHDAVRVTVLRLGGSDAVQAVHGGGTEGRQGCTWPLLYTPRLDDTPYGTSAGPMPTGTRERPTRFTRTCT